MPSVEDLTPVEPVPEDYVQNDNEDIKDSIGRPTGTVKNSIFSYVQKIQRYSSYAFTGFLAMHASSVIIAPLVSIAAGEYTLQFTSAIYRSPVVEPWLVYGSLGAHITAGLILRAHKIYLYRQHYEQWKFPKPSALSLSGFMLTPVLLAHIIATRVGPLLVWGDSSLMSLRYIAHGFHRSKVWSWAAFTPLVVLTLYHTIWGWKKWWSLYGRRYKNKTRMFYYGGILGSIISLIRISRIAQATGWLASQYDAVYTRLYL